MKNNRGQSLVIFVIIIPLLIGFLCFVVDMSYLSSEQNKLDNLNEYIIKLSFKNTNELETAINLNDKEVILKNLTIENNIINISLEKEINSMFGSIIGLDKYKLKSKYSANLETQEIRNKN